VIAGPDQGRTFSLVEGPPLMIGRGRNLEGMLSDPHMGRVHCQIQLQGDRVLLSDGGSTGGTQVNGARVTQHELQAGDVIQIGNTKLTFQWSEADEQTTAEHSRPEGP